MKELHWHALNYRTAQAPEEVQKAWQELEAFVKGREQMTEHASMFGFRSTVLDVGQGAEEAADKPDVKRHDRDSYIAGYQDACVDCDEAIRSGVPQTEMVEVWPGLRVNKRMKDEADAEYRARGGHEWKTTL